MRIYIVIPAHNEESSIALTLQSLIDQTRRPLKLVVVNDGSSDKTLDIATDFANKFDWIELVNSNSDKAHMPGSKVIKAFYKGFESLDDNYDIICKFDADIILPNNYLERIAEVFANNSKIGMAGGLLYIKKNDQWIYENIASKGHVRGPVKAYRKSCFQEIDGLKAVIGWDTIDSLLSQYYGWQVKTVSTLQVSHLKPRGQRYTKKAKLLEGERWYNMRYGFWLTLIASIKSAIKAKSLSLFYYSVRGYFSAIASGKNPAVTKDQGKFIRNLRWRIIRQKYFKF